MGEGGYWGSFSEIRITHTHTHTHTHAYAPVRLAGSLRPPAPPGQPGQPRFRPIKSGNEMIHQLALSAGPRRSPSVHLPTKSLAMKRVAAGGTQAPDLRVTGVGVRCSRWLQRPKLESPCDLSCDSGDWTRRGYPLYRPCCFADKQQKRRCGGRIRNTKNIRGRGWGRGSEIDLGLDRTCRCHRGCWAGDISGRQTWGSRGLHAQICF